MNKFFTFFLLASLVTAPASAQSRKAKAAEKKTPEQELYDELLLSTAKIMFIDSLVVDKETFLSLLPLPKDVGTLTGKNGDVEYTNEFADTRIVASGDTISGRHLYIAHRYGDEWEEARQLSEIENEMADYPFLMTDGITLYFSAEGEGTVGGRDIFRTTYDAEDHTFYYATNMGLPFNSPQNDYLLAISDMDNLGWLVSDRNQEEGKVCIYTFEPTAQRVTFDEDTDPELIKNYAEIRHIKDSWTFGDLIAARERKAALLERLEEKEEDESIMFVVNDNTVYTSLSDFKSDADREEYRKIQEN